MEEEQHHVKTREKNCSQPERISLLKKKRQEKFHLHSVWKDFHKQTQSWGSHEDPHWRETVHMRSVREEIHTTRKP